MLHGADLRDLGVGEVLRSGTVAVTVQVGLGLVVRRVIGIPAVLSGAVLVPVVGVGLLLVVVVASVVVAASAMVAGCVALVGLSCWAPQVERGLARGSTGLLEPR